MIFAKHVLRGASAAALLAALSIPVIPLAQAPAGDAASDADARAAETERRMTDDERFSLIISVIGPAIGLPRDERIPAMSRTPVPGTHPAFHASAFPRCRAATRAWG